MEGFENGFEHLREELKRVTLLLRRAVLLARAAQSAELPESLAGQVISDQEIETLLRSDDLLAARWAPVSLPESVAEQVSGLEDRIDSSRKTIDERVRASAQKGVDLPLVRLAAEFSLTLLEQEALLLALAPELDPSYERIFAYLHDDVTQTRPTVDLLLNVICRSEKEKVDSRAALAPGSKLRHFGFLEVNGESSASLLRRSLRVDEIVVRFLLEQESPSATIGILQPAPSADAAEKLPAKSRAEVERLIDALTRHDTSHFSLLLNGPDGRMLEAAARAVAYALRRRTLSVSLDEGSGKLLGKLHLALRDASLWEAILVIKLASTDMERESPMPALLAEIQELAGVQRQPMVLLAPPGVTPVLPTDAAFWSLSIDEADFADRVALWTKAAEGVEGADPKLLADSFRFNEQQVGSAYRLAYGAAAIRNPPEPQVTGQDLMEASRRIAAPRLKRFAIPIRPRYQWTDIVLPPARLEQLHSIAARIRHRYTVNQEWGFGAKSSRGLGQNVLFTGASGTGKTMAAEVLANELSLHLFQIDLSTVVSKFVGETEKHLAAVFDEAELSNCLLFFDECDALFGKRTELKDAHDRYSNIEVNFLLQRIEQYQGMVILASNLQKNIDDAFLRRLHEVIDFPFPDEKARNLIWRRHFPKDAPLDIGVDAGFLARQFKLSGGNIANAVRNAAYAAAADGQPISMKHLIRAVRDEYGKLGKLALRTEFEPYFHFLECHPNPVTAGATQ